MKTTENTFLTKQPSGHGHWLVTAESGDHKGYAVTSDSMLIDDAFNSDEDNLCYYASIDEARQVLIDKIFNQ